MNPITIEIHASELASAITALANALSGRPAAAPEMPAPVPVPVPASAPAPAAPVVPQAAPTPATPMPAPAPAPVPTTAPQTYTLPQLQTACAPLLDAGRQQELVAMLQSFGVQAMTQLPQDKYGAFATALRGMGAKL